MKNLLGVLLISTFAIASLVVAQEVPQTGFKAAVSAAPGAETKESALWNKKHHHHHHHHKDRKDHKHHKDHKDHKDHKHHKDHKDHKDDKECDRGGNNCKDA
ncbi:hypothetical protein BGZ98_003011, partial [Dissophora globulifera]